MTKKQRLNKYKNMVTGIKILIEQTQSEKKKEEYKHSINILRKAIRRLG